MENGNKNDVPKFNWKLPLYGAIGFGIASVIGFFIGDAIGSASGNYELVNTAGSIENIIGSIGFIVMGAIIGAIFGLLSAVLRIAIGLPFENKKNKVLYSVCMGAVGGGIGLFMLAISIFITAFVIKSVIGISDWGIIPAGIIAAGITGIIGGAALGLALKDKKKIIYLSLAGAVGSIIGLVIWFALLGDFWGMIGIFTGAAIWGATVGAALGLALKDKKKILYLSLAGAISGIIGVAARDVAINVIWNFIDHYLSYSAQEFIGLFIIASFIGASLGLTFAYITKEKEKEIISQRYLLCGLAIIVVIGGILIIPEHLLALKWSHSFDDEIKGVYVWDLEGGKGIIVNSNNRIYAFSGNGDVLWITEIIDEIDLKSRYFFSWDDILENNRTELADSFEHTSLSWVRDAEIKKSDDNKTITFMNGENTLTLKLNKEKNSLLMVGDEANIECLLKKENGKLNIYLPSSTKIIPPDHKPYFLPNYKSQIKNIDENLSASVQIKKAQCGGSGWYIGIDKYGRFNYFYNTKRQYYENYPYEKIILNKTYTYGSCCDGYKIMFTKEEQHNGVNYIRILENLTENKSCRCSNGGGACIGAEIGMLKSADGKIRYFSDLDSDSMEEMIVWNYEENTIKVYESNQILTPLMKFEYNLKNNTEDLSEFILSVFVIAVLLMLLTKKLKQNKNKEKNKN